MSSKKSRPITKEEILKLAKLTNLNLSDLEVDKYQAEVSDILVMINKLNDIDTTGVEPTYQVSGNKNVYREDVISTDLVAPNDLINLAPDSKKSQIKVGKVL